MKFDITSWEQKKKEIEKQKAEYQKDKNKLEFLTEQLESDFGCTLEQAPAKQKELQNKMAKLETELDHIADELAQYE